MADSTLANLTAATPATGGLFYGTQSGNDRKFTLTAAGATLAEAANAAAQLTAINAVEKASTPATTATGGTLYGTQSGNARNFTVTAAGATLMEAANSAAQLTALGAVAKSTYDANSILAANTDDTPVAVTVAEQRIIGRVTGGNIDDLTPAQVRSIINAVYNYGNTGTATVTLDAANGVAQKATLTGNITLAAPSNPVEGMEMSVQLTASGGARTITLSGITVPTGVTFTGTVASGSVRRLKLFYTGSAWLLTSNLEFA
jgi:hypothetical protein